jgi:hypothetical protein
MLACSLHALTSLARSVSCSPRIDSLQVASFLALGTAFLRAFIVITGRWIDKRDRFPTLSCVMTLFFGDNARLAMLR